MAQSEMAIYIHGTMHSVRAASHCIISKLFKPGLSVRYIHTYLLLIVIDSDIEYCTCLVNGRYICMQLYFFLPVDLH